MKEHPRVACFYGLLRKCQQHPGSSRYENSEEYSEGAAKEILAQMAATTEENLERGRNKEAVWLLDPRSG